MVYDVLRWLDHMEQSIHNTGFLEPRDEIMAPQAGIGVDELCVAPHRNSAAHYDVPQDIETSHRGALARHKKRRSAKAKAVENLQYICRTWGQAVAKFYGWGVGTAPDCLRLLSKAAALYKDFKTFAQVANMVLLRRHQASLSGLIEPNYIGQPAQLTIYDLSLLRRPDVRTRLVYGRPILREFDWEVGAWIRDTKGLAWIVDSITLVAAKGERFAHYLLDLDKYGMLISRQPTPACGQTSTPGRFTVEGIRSRTDLDSPERLHKGASPSTVPNKCITVATCRTRELALQNGENGHTPGTDLEFAANSSARKNTHIGATPPLAHDGSNAVCPLMENYGQDVET